MTMGGRGAYGRSCALHLRRRNVGALRFLGLVMLPFFVASVVLLLAVLYAKRRQASRQRRIQKNLQAGEQVRSGRYATPCGCVLQLRLGHQWALRRKA